MKLFRILLIASFLTLALAGCAAETQEKNVYEKTMDKSKDVSGVDNERVKEMDQQLETLDNITK
ncbi:MAG: hypothetical protein IJ583_02020 [Firmicutes bacterium]|nr:hypothetical protein [Bacillota bacterium]